jgi:hypothetical protein
MKPKVSIFAQAHASKIHAVDGHFCATSGFHVYGTKKNEVKPIM